VELDYVIQPNGISLFTPRIKGGERFIPFDKPAPYGNGSFLRLRARNKVLNMALKRPEPAMQKGGNQPQPALFSEIPMPPKMGQEQPAAQNLTAQTNEGSSNDFSDILDDFNIGNVPHDFYY
jgi:hypothetical protein